MREASTRSIVVPAAVTAVVETTIVHRAVDGFSCDGCKVQHDPKKRERQKEGEKERGLASMRVANVKGCCWILLRGRGRIAGCNVGRCSLLHTELTGAE